MENDCSVMVVEDDRAIRETLADLLEMEGYKVVAAANGAEALARLQASGSTHVILLDLMMPVMDGWEFRARQRKDPKLSGIHVIVLSAASPLREKVANLAADAWIPKPFNAGQLLATVERLC